MFGTRTIVLDTCLWGLFCDRVLCLSLMLCLTYADAAHTPSSVVGNRQLLMTAIESWFGRFRK
jgi:hypothetical protein